MKPFNPLSLLIFLIPVYSCNFKSDHPQADLVKDQSSTGINDKLIVQLVDSVNKNLNTFDRKYSLVYMLGDNSLYVEQFTKAPDYKVYYEHVSNGSISSIVNKYYFKNDSLVLIETNSRQIIENGQLFKDTRIYFRNHTVFKRETRTASSSSAIKTLPYLSQPADSQALEEGYFENIKVLNDALQQNNKFEMVFDNITTYPDSRYLTLKSKIQNSYSASVLIENNDTFIDSLLNNTAAFKEEKLKFKWKIENDEAVYIPKVQAQPRQGD